MHFQLYKPGMRTIKTTIAIGLCCLFFIPFQTWFSSVFFFGVLEPLYACISAVICIQSTVDKTIKQGCSRMIGTAIGGCVGLLFLWFNPSVWGRVQFAILLSFCTLAVIWISNSIGRPTASSIGVVVLCVIVMNHGGSERYIYAFSRIIETAVGVIIAVGVDIILPQPKTDWTQPSTQK